MLRNPHLLSLVVAAALVLASAPSPAAPPGQESPVKPETAHRIEPGTAAALDRYLSRLEALGFAGATLVALDGEIVLARGHGLADRGRAIPWTAATASTIGSITKQFTATAILKLVTDGKVATGDRIARFFGGVPDDKAEITVHQLLTHTAGLPDVLGGDFDLVERDELVARAMAAPLESAPGETYAYSNLGYSLLGAIVERVTGRDYETYLREELLAPAGLFETGYRTPELEPARVARGYRAGEEWGTLLERPWLDDGPSWNLRANGGIHSTVFDMYRWIRALEEGRVLPAEVRERLFTPVADEGGGSFYAYGWATAETDRGTRVVGHSGGNGILFSDLRWFRDEGVLLFMMTNVAEFPAESVTPQLAAILFDEPYVEPPAVVPVEPARLSRLAGTYRLAGGGELVVEAGEAALRIEPRGTAAFAAVFSAGPGTAGGAPGEAARSNDRRVAEIVSGILEGDYGPLTAAYGGQYTLEHLTGVYSRRVEDLEAELGPAAGFEVLGGTGERTWFRIDFRDGTFWGRYLWDGTTLRGLQILDGPERITAYPVATEPSLELQAFALGSDLETRFVFSSSKDLVVRTGEAEIVASRVPD